MVLRAAVFVEVVVLDLLGGAASRMGNDPAAPRVRGSREPGVDDDEVGVDCRLVEPGQGVRCVEFTLHLASPVAAAPRCVVEGILRNV